MGEREAVAVGDFFFFFSYFSEIEMHVKLYGFYLFCDRFFE